MGLETGDFLSDLIITNPVTASDSVTEGSNHIRLVKKVLTQTFGPMNGLWQLPDNNVWIKQSNAAANGQVNMIKVNTADQVELGDTAGVLIPKLTVTTLTVKTMTSTVAGLPVDLIVTGNAQALNIRRDIDTLFLGCGMDFSMLDSVGAPLIFAQIITTIVKNDAGDADGNLNFHVLDGSTLTLGMVVKPAVINIRPGFDLLVQGGNITLATNQNVDWAGGSYIREETNGGATVQGSGASFDFTIHNQSALDVLRIPANTKNVEMTGDLDLSGGTLNVNAGTGNRVFYGSSTTNFVTMAMSDNVGSVLWENNQGSYNLKTGGDGDTQGANAVTALTVSANQNVSIPAGNLTVAAGTLTATNNVAGGGGTHNFVNTNTGRALTVSRSVSAATRDVMSVSQTSVTGGTDAALSIQQADLGEIALKVTENGTVANFFVKSTGDVMVAGLLVGIDTGITIGFAVPALQVVGQFSAGPTQPFDGSIMAAARFSVDTGAPRVSFLKSRALVAGGLVAVAANDSLGDIDWYGDDGVDYVTNAGQIQMTVVGTVSTNIIPTIMKFKTMTTAGVLTTGLTVSETQDVSTPGDITAFA